MSRKGFGRRLERLEEPRIPSRQQYLDAKERTIAHVMQSFGAELEPHEGHDLGPGYGENDFAADSTILARYRTSLDPESPEREQHGLMRRLYHVLERRGISSWGEENSAEDKDEFAFDSWPRRGVCPSPPSGLLAYRKSMQT